MTKEKTLDLIAIAACVTAAALAARNVHSQPNAVPPQPADKPGEAKPAKKVDPFERAIRDGRVLPGMTPEQVRRAMAGAPQSILRAASSRSINEVWIFGRVGRTRTVVHFRRHRTQPRSRARVTNVSNFRQ
ncbi:MAG: hypothetical protein ACE5KM_15370 [Planctomycetaceae bacterium]